MASLNLLSTVVAESMAQGEEKSPKAPQTKSATKKRKVAKKDTKKIVAKVGAAVKPKRPLTAYNFFFQAERAKLLGIELPTSNKTPEVRKRRKHRKTHGKYGFTEMSRIISQKWSQIDQETRAKYVEKQEEDAKRYKAELDAYKKCLNESCRDARLDRTPEKQGLRSHSIDDGLASLQDAGYALPAVCSPGSIGSDARYAARGEVGYNPSFQAALSPLFAPQTRMDEIELARQELLLRANAAQLCSGGVYPGLGLSNPLTMMGLDAQANHLRSQMQLQALAGGLYPASRDWHQTQSLQQSRR